MANKNYYHFLIFYFPFYPNAYYYSARYSANYVCLLVKMNDVDKLGNHTM